MVSSLKKGITYTTKVQLKLDIDEDIIVSSQPKAKKGAYKHSGSWIKQADNEGVVADDTTLAMKVSSSVISDINSGHSSSGNRFLLSDASRKSGQPKLKIDPSKVNQNIGQQNEGTWRKTGKDNTHVTSIRLQFDNNLIEPSSEIANASELNTTNLCALNNFADNLKMEEKTWNISGSLVVDNVGPEVIDEIPQSTSNINKGNAIINNLKKGTFLFNDLVSYLKSVAMEEIGTNEKNDVIRDLINNDQNGPTDKEQDPMIHEMIEEFIKIYNTIPDSVIISHDHVQLSDNASNSFYTTAIPNNTTISPPHNDASPVPHTNPSVINESSTESNENMSIITDQKRYLAFQYKLSLIEEKLKEIMFLKSIKRQTLVESKALSLIYPSISDKFNQQIGYENDASALLNSDKKSLPYSSINSTLVIPHREMMPKQLWETTMDPTTRTLKLVSVENTASANTTFSVLMGDNVLSRKEPLMLASPSSYPNKGIYI
jgi:hypothetical protein